MVESKYFGFSEALRESTKDYRGKNAALVRMCPDLFNLLCKIINDRRTDWHIKIHISAALAYFVIPEDIIKDSEEGGYIDDLYIILFVLKSINDKGFDYLIKENWSLEEDIIEIIEKYYLLISNNLGDKKDSVLNKVGLNKLNSLDLGEYSGEYSNRLRKLSQEKRELLGMLAFILKTSYKYNLGRGLNPEKVRTVLMTFPDYDELERLIELSKKDHQYKEKNLDITKQTKTETNIDSEKLKKWLSEN